MDEQRSTEALTGEQRVITLVIPRDDGSLLLVHPDVLYTTDEVRVILRLKNIDSVYRIPGSELPWHGIGQGRRIKLYWGRDIISYIEAGKCPSSRTAARTTRSGARLMASGE